MTDDRPPSSPPPRPAEPTRADPAEPRPPDWAPPSSPDEPAPPDWAPPPAVPSQPAAPQWRPPAESPPEPPAEPPAEVPPWFPPEPAAPSAPAPQPPPAPEPPAPDSPESPDSPGSPDSPDSPVEPLDSADSPAAVDAPDAPEVLAPEPLDGLAPDLPEPAAAVAPVGMAPADLRAALEAILLVVDEPVTEQLLAEVVGEPVERVAGTLTELSAEYTTAGRGFDLRRAAGGWRFYTRAAQAPYVERFVLDGQQARLTQAALETLAVIAYRQPVTRSRVSAVRGVNCDGVIRTLLTRGLIEEAGSEPETGAHLYRTTSVFLEKLGLDSLAELPPLAPFLPEDVSALDPDPPPRGDNGHRDQAGGSDQLRVDVAGGPDEEGTDDSA